MSITEAAETVKKIQDALAGWKSAMSEAEVVSLKRAGDALCDFIRARAERVQEDISQVVK